MSKEREQHLLQQQWQVLVESHFSPLCVFKSQKRGTSVHHCVFSKVRREESNICCNISDKCWLKATQHSWSWTCVSPPNIMMQKLRWRILHRPFLVFFFTFSFQLVSLSLFLWFSVFLFLHNSTQRWPPWSLFTFRKQEIPAPGSSPRSQHGWPKQCIGEDSSSKVALKACCST